ncbi:SPOR domain-containing protein [Aquimarina longa]|uniref:HU domain-containing protein n=1 Tax=Aquimarina longa TaxID=1080221 RepID=UPI000785861F|nr:SPOR domain-containing protein [Aquimarina longa]
MNTTANYISELLYRYECVIVPGFGAFLTRRQPAMIQKDTNSFYPPQKLISFNSQLQNNDGLLANYIASAENISYTDAVAKIQRYIVSLKEKMAQGQRVELEKIGVFFTSIENTLQFEPIQEVNYLTEAFGLHSFAYPIIKREVYKKETEAIEETTPLTFTPEKRRERPYLQYAAVAAVVLGIGGFFGLKQVSDTTISYNNQELKKANQEIDNKIQEATFEITNPLPAINLNIIKDDEKGIITDIAATKFHIVAGAFRVKSNAYKKIEKLKKLGYNASLIGINKYDLHQVAYETYENRTEAVNALREIKKHQNSGAWLLIKE